MKNRNKLIFYNEYEEFYAMAKSSKTFSDFCREAFGNDLSQDGFSDMTQANLIRDNIPNGTDVKVLDIGCGNGKLLAYLQEYTRCRIYGFDYSETAIKTAKELYPNNSDFKVGIIGDALYQECFDLIISMDTIYFASDMDEFVKLVKSWLKVG